MGFPSFSAGEVLTAADMNAVGLWRVASGTLSGNSVNFVGCFTSNYTNYRIVLDSVGFSSAGDVYYQFLNGSTPRTTANYYWAYSGLLIGGGAANSASTSTTLGYTGMSTSVGLSGAVLSGGSMDVYAPQSASQRTFLTSAAVGYTTDFYHRHGMGGFNELLTFDGIRFFTNAGPNFTGNVTIYGYRKP